MVKAAKGVETGLDTDSVDTLEALRPRRAGVIYALRVLFGANTPWKQVRFRRGFGTSSARRATRSGGSKTMWVVPSRYWAGSR